MDKSETGEFNKLLQRYLQESLTPEELAAFFELAATPENSERIAEYFQQDLGNGLRDISSPAEKQEAWIKLQSKLEKKTRPVVRMRMPLRWVAILICLAGASLTAIYLNRSKNNPEISMAQPALNTPAWLTADHVGAVLILAGGDSIVLNFHNNGIIATQDGIQVIQSGGVLRYSGKGQSSMYNEIRTVKGKLWRAVLPDQTIVWLNGNSSIKYPLQFAFDLRSVEMTGEVYFEVAHQTAYPFRVKTGRETIEDIGTSFNVHSSAGDSTSTATLVEGSVRVSLDNQQVTLVPGQQSLVTSNANEIRVVKNANIPEALAWKTGFFYFQNTSLFGVMKQLSDWYQVDVVYKGKQGNQLFSGQIDKTLSLSEVLQGLQQPGVKFSAEGNQITVVQQ